MQVLSDGTGTRPVDAYSAAKIGIAIVAMASCLISMNSSCRNTAAAPRGGAHADAIPDFAKPLGFMLSQCPMTRGTLSQHHAWQADTADVGTGFSIALAGAELAFSQSKCKQSMLSYLQM